MLTALGFGKKRAPTELQIHKHREQMRQHLQWKNDLIKIRAISSKLDNAYRNHKGDFALGRYEELKQMVKDAISEYHGLMEKSQKQSQEGAASAMASKYSSGGKQTTQQGQGHADAGQKPDGLFTKLKKHAAAFTGSTSSTTSSPPNSSKEDIKDQEMATWGYEGMNGKKVEEEAENMRKEVLQYKQEFRKERDKFERLSKEYEDSKKHTPPQRYTVLKYMIKDAVN